MSPPAWENAWKPGQLMRLSAELMEQYPSDARRFLSKFGFPRKVEFRIHRMSFEPMLADLESLGEHEWDDLADRLMIGEINVDGGPSFVCSISKSTGTITALDFHSDMPEMFVNSDLAAFGISMRSIFAMFEAIKDGAEPPANFPDEIGNVILSIDPAALDSDTCFWTGVIEFERHLASA